MRVKGGEIAAINKWKGLSGTHWDDECGANITTNADAKVWDEFVTNKVCFLPSQLRYWIFNSITEE